MADAGENESGKPADLRFTSDERSNVRVERNLSADGHLARGDGTRMSRLNMSVRAVPRAEGERDPVFAARDAASGNQAPAPPAPVVPAVPPAAPKAEPTIMQRFARLFGRDSS